MSKRVPPLLAVAPRVGRSPGYWLLVLMVMAGLGGSLHGGSRSSAAYEVTQETVDPGGGFSAGADYSHRGGFGGISSPMTQATPALVFRSGFIGQLYEAVSFEVSAPVGSVRTGTGLSVTATQQLDDGTTLVLDPTRVAWSVTSGPVAGISTAGIATAGVVATDMTATIRGGFGLWSDELTVTVLAKLAQSIVFALPAEIPFQLTPLGMDATATSGLAVGFTLVAGPAVVSGATLILSDVGSVIVRAVQEGNADYVAATPIERTVIIRVSFDHWRSENFDPTALADTNVSGPGATMADGWPNLVKYALGVPATNLSNSVLPVLMTSASDWVYLYARPTDRPDLIYTVEVSTNLTTWTTAGVTHELVSTTGGIETWRARYPLASAGSVFIRLKVVQ